MNCTTCNVNDIDDLTHHCCCCRTTSAQNCACPSSINSIFEKAKKYCEKYMKKQKHIFYPNKCISHNCVAWQRFCKTVRDKNCAGKKNKDNFDVSKYIDQTLNRDDGYSYELTYYSSEDDSDSDDYVPDPPCKSRDERFIFAFHGTSIAAGEMICCEGFNTAKRGLNGQKYGNGDYFARGSSTPLYFARKHLPCGYLVVTLIMDCNYVKYHVNGKQHNLWYIVNSEDEYTYHLPIGLVALCNNIPICPEIPSKKCLRQILDYDPLIMTNTATYSETTRNIIKKNISNRISMFRIKMDDGRDCIINLDKLVEIDFGKMLKYNLTEIADSICFSSGTIKINLENIINKYIDGTLTINAEMSFITQIHVKQQDPDVKQQDPNVKST